MSTLPAGDRGIGDRRRRLPGSRRAVLLLVGAGVLLLVAANVHLVHVALSTQPDCVPHLKSPGSEGTFRAARSAC